MADSSTDTEPQTGEIVDGAAKPLPPDHANWLALISNYTERPDLFLAEVEKHDPGFTKRMNEAARLRAEESETARFIFGRFQAYLSLGVAALAAVAVLAFIGLAVWKGAGFGTILSLGLVYAITQGGNLGFTRLIDAISQWTHSRRHHEADE